jgi:hypothetical protein
MIPRMMMSMARGKQSGMRIESTWQLAFFFFCFFLFLFSSLFYFFFTFPTRFSRSFPAIANSYLRLLFIASSLDRVCIGFLMRDSCFFKKKKKRMGSHPTSVTTADLPKTPRFDTHPCLDAAAAAAAVGGAAASRD